MTIDRLAPSSGARPVSGYRASEWAMIARAKGDKRRAEEWEQADRDGWDERCFSMGRRQELADKFPGAFGPNLEFRGQIV